MILLLQNKAMSYKVETERKEHEDLLGTVMVDWSRQEYDVHLVSTEGHKIFSHKVILAFYSSFLNEILNDPVTKFTPGPVTISIPASISTIASLLKLLVNGRVGANDINGNEEVKEAARSLGIQMRNCLVDAKRLAGSVAGLTVIKLPLKKPPAGEKPPLNSSVKAIPKPLKLVPKSLGTLRQATTTATKPLKKVNLSTSLNTSVIKKSSGLRVELKEFVNEETSRTNQIHSTTKLEKKNSSSTSGKHVCDVCQKSFLEDRFLRRHRYRVHGIKKGKKGLSLNTSLPSNLGGVKQEKEDKPLGPPRCRVCSKRFQSQEILDRHMRKKHGERNLQCDMCEKRFKGPSELRIHKRIHLPDEEKPYQCDICGKRFCQAGQKRVHLQKFHGVIEKPGSKVEMANGVVVDPIGIVNETEDNVRDETETNDQRTAENEENSEDGLDTSELPTDDEIGLEQTEDDTPEIDSNNIILETEDNHKIILDEA